MFVRKDLLDNIINKLSFVKAKVEISAPLNLLDTNVITENFYRDLFKLVYGYNLKNMNKIVSNAVAIDLGDEDKRVCVQVTSTSTSTKTKSTVAKFIQKDLQKKFDRLIIFNIVSKSAHREAKIGDPNKFELDTANDVLDVSGLLKEIGDIPDSKEEKLREISEFFDRNVKFQNPETIAKEIVTFMSLITYLSDESQPSAGAGFLEEPDPDGKVNKRFADHADFLIKQFQDLYIEYGKVLEDVLAQADMGQTRIRRLGLHLKNESDTYLTEANGDPQIALEGLTNRYESLLQEKGSEFDRTAIKFFLIEQLIKCNVFPNKESLS